MHMLVKSGLNLGFVCAMEKSLFSCLVQFGPTFFTILHTRDQQYEHYQSSAEISSPLPFNTLCLLLAGKNPKCNRHNFQILHEFS